MTACLCWLVKAIIKHLLSVDLELAERGGQLLITNAYFHAVLLLSLLMVWYANGYSGYIYFAFLLIYSLSCQARNSLIAAKSSPNNICQV